MKKTNQMPIVALVGRTNVGKSTLWNRLTETAQALISAHPNTTRDRNYAPVLWRGISFQLVDTGGMDTNLENEIGIGIVRQAELAMKEADLVILVIDMKTGIMPQDKEFAEKAKKLNTHLLLVGNKADDIRTLGSAASKEVFALGMGPAVAASATTGRGIGDLCDRIHEELRKINKPPTPYEDEKGLKLVVMGRPNVGKSSIVNALLGEERAIVANIPHTTREPADTTFSYQGETITLVDTAGMRKRSRVERGLEEAAIEKNREALLRSDIAFLVIDATLGPQDQDKHLAGLLKDANRGLVIVVNKWDLINEKHTGTVNEFEARFRLGVPFLWWAPMIFTSALKHQRMNALLELAFKIREERRREISYNALQKFLKICLAKKRPLQESGPSSPYVHDVKQVGIEPPKFIITVRGNKGDLHPSWLRFFENRLREKFGFTGTPIIIESFVEPMIRSEMPEEKKNRKTRRKRPIGRRVGRY